jgi:transposase InsO family protein
MEERAKFIADWLYGDETMTGLCASFGVSRKTGYKWLGRFRSEGERGLADRSRRPQRSGRLLLDAPRVRWPAASTIGDLLKRQGLCGTRRRRRGTPAYGSPLTPGEAPNEVWGADFKGWFKTGNGARCEPVTVSDLASRYLLRCEPVRRPDSEHLRPIFEAAFKEHGLPVAIRMDNGPPFASRGLGGLTPLSVWWLKCIDHDLI